MDQWKGYPVFDDASPLDDLFPKGVGYGYDPGQYVPSMYATPPSEVPSVPESEWEARIQEQEEQQSSLEHIWRTADNGHVPLCLDQDGHGYCWAYSCGSALMLLRAKANQRFVRLNPHSTASIIKNGQDQGGWCGLSCQFVETAGMAPEGTGPGEWPVHSRDYRLYDRPEVKAAMKSFLASESWMDLKQPAYDRKMTFAQVASVLLSQNTPCQVDFNWWGHSVCAMRVVKVEAGRFGLMILNSWAGWGQNGMSVLTGSKMLPDGAVGVRGTTGDRA
jgi:hypothetical protein